MHDIDVIKSMMAEISEKLKLPEIEHWTNSNFSDISEAIFVETKILLSRNTIKNMVQKVLQNDTTFAPQQSTRLALSQYLGFKTWNDYKQNSPRFKKLNLPTEDDIPSSKSPKFDLKKWALIFGIGIILVLGVFWLIKSQTNRVKELPFYEFNITDSIGSAPYTVSFTYDFSNFKDDTVFIDLDTYSGAKKYELRQLQNNKGNLNFCYNHPGFYKVALFINSNKVKEFKILIKSGQWNATVYNALEWDFNKPPFLADKKKVWPLFINFDNVLTESFINEGNMHVTNNLVKEISNIGTNYITQFSLYKEFIIDGDNFEMSSGFYNSDYDKGNICYLASFELVGEHGNIRCTLLQPGCKNHVSYEFSEVAKHGGSSNIEGFEFEFTKSQTIKIENLNKQITLSMNGVVFHQNSYNKSIGKLIGINLRFKGSATVEFIKVLDLKSSQVFEDDF